MGTPALHRFTFPVACQQRLEFSGRVAAVAMDALLAAAFLPGAGPGWGGGRTTTLYCTAALRSLVENVQVSQTA